MSAQPPRIESPRDLLLDDLKRLLTVETTLAGQMLPKLLQEVQNEELKSALEEHHEETKRHVVNVRQSFQKLDEEPEGKDAPGLEGLKQEYESGRSEVAPSVRESFNAGAAIGTEHYEIAIYSGALLLAKAVEAGDIVELLGTNLQQEFAALKKLETLAEKLTAKS